MFRIEKLESIEVLHEMKQAYMDLTTAPLDGMWLTGFVPMATHYGFYDGDLLIGYCCINDEGCLLQVYVSPGHAAEDWFDALLSEPAGIGKINGAFVSTAEPQYLSLCFDRFNNFAVNARMYQLADRKAADPALELSVVNDAQLDEMVLFAHQAIGAPTEWLSGYFGHLISRAELYACWKDDRVVATGECRGYDAYQMEYADVGMIVAEAERGKGLATKMLKGLVAIAESRGLKPICSTEAGNTGAQKAISRAGFVSHNRIIIFTR